MQDFLNIQNVSKAYIKDRRKITVFEKLNLKIKDNCHIISVIGPDGSGKSTLLKLIASIIKQDIGTITFKKSYSIGYMSQNLNLYKELSVYENLELFATLNDVKETNLKAYLEELLKKVGLLYFKDYSASSLSGGMKQKLALCCSIASKPNVLILDEPTVGVDPISRRELWDIILSFVKENGSYCIFSSLYLEESDISDSTVLMQNGKILLNDEALNIKNKVKDRCFRLKLSSTVYQKVCRIFIHKTSSYIKESPILDVCPRLGFIDILITINSSFDYLFSYVKKILDDLLIHDFSIVPRNSLLEDAYIALTCDGKERDVCNLKNDDFINTTKSIDSIFKEKSYEHIINVENVIKRFGDFVAVEKSNFYVDKGEIFGLLGPNGAGKTTTFRMICALLKPTDGEIKIAGYNLLKDKTAIRSQIGYVAQKFCLYQNLTVNENMRYFARSYGLKGRDIDIRVNELLARFDLSTYKNVVANDLPFGHKRNLSMACALLHKPKILFLDEATSGADPTSRRKFWALITELSLSGTSVIVTTHFMEEAEYCDRFLIQDKGKILILGKPDCICVKDGRRISIEDTFLNVIKESRGNSAK